MVAERSLARALRSLSDAALADLCLRLTDDETELDEVAARSYSHPNGFAKIVLARTSRYGCELRLHIWQGSGRADPHVHDHPWDFAARILRGAYEATTFAECSGDKGEPWESHASEILNEPGG